MYDYYCVWIIYIFMFYPWSVVECLPCIRHSLLSWWIPVQCAPLFAGGGFLHSLVLDRWPTCPHLPIQGPHKFHSVHPPSTGQFSNNRPRLHCNLLSISSFISRTKKPMVRLSVNQNYVFISSYATETINGLIFWYLLSFDHHLIRYWG